MNGYNKPVYISTCQLESIQSNNKCSPNKSCNLYKSSNSTSIGDCFFSLNPNEFTALATILGFIIANGLTIDQQNSLGSFIEQVGQTISTISTQGSTLQSNNNKNDVSEQLELIKKQIKLIEKNI